MSSDKAISLDAQPRNLSALPSGVTLVISESAVKALDGSGKEVSKLSLKYNAGSITASPDGKVIAVGGEVSGLTEELRDQRLSGRGFRLFRIILCIYMIGLVQS